QRSIDEFSPDAVLRQHVEVIGGPSLRWCVELLRRGGHGDLLESVQHVRCHYHTRGVLAGPGNFGGRLSRCAARTGRMRPMNANGVPGGGLAKGLAITLRTMTRRSHTQQYP